MKKKKRSKFFKIYFILVFLLLEFILLKYKIKFYLDYVSWGKIYELKYLSINLYCGYMII